MLKSSRPDFHKTRLLYHSPQFRVVLLVKGDAVLVKGMIVISETLGRKLRLRRSCIKAQWQPDHDAGLTYGLDIVQASQSTQGKPQLHTQLASVLALRACLPPTWAARNEAKAEVRESCRDRRDKLEAVMERTAPLQGQATAIRQRPASHSAFKRRARSFQRRPSASQRWAGMRGGQVRRSHRGPNAAEPPATHRGVAEAMEVAGHRRQRGHAARRPAIPCRV